MRRGLVTGPSAPARPPFLPPTTLMSNFWVRSRRGLTQLPPRSAAPAERAASSGRMPGTPLQNGLPASKPKVSLIGKPFATLIWGHNIAPNLNSRMLLQAPSSSILWSRRIATDERVRRFLVMSGPGYGSLRQPHVSQSLPGRRRANVRGSTDQLFTSTDVAAHGPTSLILRPEQLDPRRAGKHVVQQQLGLDEIPRPKLRRSGGHLPQVVDAVRQLDLPD